MKTNLCSLLLASVFLGVVPFSAAAQVAQPAQPPALPGATLMTATNAGGARIQFETPIFDFGRIKSGEVVKHTYYFTNAGDQTLYLTNVHPQCGCTAAGEWTRQVEPGQFGSIPVQFNSANFQGMVFKSIAVICNDKTQPTISLQLKGTIWKPIDVAPLFAVLNIPPDAQTASTTVRIINNMDDPITVSPPESNNKSFTAAISTNQPGKEFQVVVTAVPPLSPGNVQGQISIRTSSTNMPVVIVTVWANVQPAVLVMPPQVTLPPAPLANPLTPIVNIQNNSTNALSLSEPTINAKGVNVQLNETIPGRAFSVTLSVPQGFEMPPGEPVALTLKSSNPQHALIRIPINQIPRPVAPAPAPPRAQLVPAPMPPTPAQVTHQ